MFNMLYDTGSEKMKMTMNFLHVLILVWIQVVSFFQPSIAWTTTSTTTGSRQTSLIHLYGAAISTDGTSAAISSAPVLSVENLSCTHNGGETYQLRNVDFNLQRGAKAALIGRNGTGKSTLLKILHESYLFTNNITPSSTSDYKYTGKIQIPKTIRISMVDQEPPAPADVTVGDAILGINKDYDVFASSISASKNVMDVVRRYVVLSKYVADNVGNDEADNANLFVEASADMDMFNGWDILTLSEEIVTKLKVRHLQDEPLTSLSGGERKRVALCAALVESPDVLLLDEPTNFLSLAGVEWLSDLLTEKKSDLTILMVTHDRAFLQQTCDRIVELDRGSLYEHPGSYSTYLQAKEERLAVEDAFIQSAKSKYKIELEWMRRQPQARESKSKSRIDAFYKLEKATKPRPHDPNLNLVEISDGSTRRIGSTIVSMKGVSLTFRSAGDEGHRKMLDDFSYDFCFGDRICLAGANGVGKTTFTKLITREIEPDTGIIDVGDTVVLGVYDQLGLNFDTVAESQTVLEYVVDQIHANEMKSMSETPSEARKLLQQFEFPRSRWNEQISILSGGERRRLQMLSVLSAKPNFLVLDEPSVDCDLDTLSALENYLMQFQGVLLVVSHDRSFADKVTDHLFVFEGDGIVKDFRGSLSEYSSCLVELENKRIQYSLEGNADETTSSSNNKKFNYKEDRAKRNEVRNFARQSKKEMLNIERSLEQLKPTAAVVQSDIDGTSTDEGWSILAELTNKLNKINDEIDKKEIRWLELAEELEEIDLENA